VHLTIVFIALALTRPLRDITIRIAGNDIIATTQPGPEAATILDTITR
jgi:hypothetical protein